MNLEKTYDYDIVIIGAGFSGLYAAYKILKLSRDIKIGIFEKLGCAGGRIITGGAYGHVLEYGPMRFEPALQPNLAQLLGELGIDTAEFPPYTCPLTKPDYNKLDLEEIKCITKYKDLPPAFALLKYGLTKVLGDQWDVEGDNIHARDRDARKSWLKSNGTFQGRLLNQHGLWDTLAHVLSKEAIDHIMHKGTFYHMIHLNPNAADQMCFMLDVLATASHGLITIKGGSSILIDALLMKVGEKCEMHFDSQLLRFEDIGDTIKCSFDRANIGTILCKELILTCQQTALKRIVGFETNIYKLLDSVQLCELFKIFVVIDNPPFKDTSLPAPNYGAEKLPCREIHYQYNPNNNTGMIMIYGDVPSLKYWSYIVEESDDKLGIRSGDNWHLRHHIQHYLRAIFPCYYGNILYCSMIDWSTHPHENGVHLWKPKQKSESVIHALKSFGRVGRIHICGETYSNYQGFIEGCIRSVNNVIDDIKKKEHVLGVQEHDGERDDEISLIMWSL